jgi:hypothetical protein
MALLYEICKRRGTTIVIASQYDVSPLLIAESDQLRIEYRKGILSNFHSTIAELSNDSCKFFQSILQKAWNEHCQLPATSLLQKSLIDLDEKARQNRILSLPQSHDRLFDDRILLMLSIGIEQHGKRIINSRQNQFIVYNISHSIMPTLSLSTFLSLDLNIGR